MEIGKLDMNMLLFYHKKGLIKVQVLFICGRVCNCASRRSWAYGPVILILQCVCLLVDGSDSHH